LKMRSINVVIALTAEQLEQLTSATAQILSAADPRRYMRQHARLWSNVSSALEAASGGKCWYCETARNRSNYGVDHFRPKSRVTECPQHPGYWWLAFDLSNFRLACTYCNERRVAETTAGGKAGHFPLLIEARRCMNPAGCIAQEQPILLDPLDPSDPPLLKFLMSGDVMPRMPQNIDAIAYRRARDSIEIFHLHEARLVRGRGDKIRLVSSLLQVVENLAEDVSIRRTIIRQIREMVDSTGEYSGAICDALSADIERFLAATADEAA